MLSYITKLAILSLLGMGLSNADEDLTRNGPAPAIRPPAAGQTQAAPSTRVAPQATGILDDFNRADGPIGPSWTVQAGAFNVVSQAAQGGATALATFNGGTGNTLEADVEVTGTATQYTGLVLGYADLSNNYFLKVQQQDGGGTFDHAACYFGNNGGGFGLGFFPLNAPFKTAHMKVVLSGTTVTMTFSKIDGGAGAQTYTCDGAPATGGTGIGISGYDAGFARLDNFANGPAGPSYTVVQSVRVADTNGNSSPEEATLIKDSTAGTTQVWIRDSKTKSLLKKLNYGVGYEPVSLTVLEDTNGNGSQEVAVTVKRNATNDYVLLIRDIKSGTLIRTLNLP